MLILVVYIHIGGRIAKRQKNAFKIGRKKITPENIFRIKHDAEYRHESIFDRIQRKRYIQKIYMPPK